MSFALRRAPIVGAAGGIEEATAAVMADLGADPVWSAAPAMIAGQPVDLTQIPLRRKSRPGDIAWPIAFLCSPAARSICGTVLDVNGGVTMT